MNDVLIITYCKIEAGPRRTKKALLLIKFMKYEIVQFLLYEYLEESQSCVIINLHEQETYKFVQFSDIAKNWNVCTPIIVNISNPNPRSKKF